MDSVLAIGILAAIALVAFASRPKAASGLDSDPLSIQNIRMGVAERWYTCTLVRVDGVPAVRLSGKLASGQPYSDVFRITEADWQTLRDEGYPTEK